jgi:hypothetical protein
MYLGGLAKPSRQGLVLELGRGKYEDTSGQNNTITNNDSTLTTDHNGRANRGFAFDGSNDYIAVPSTILSELTKFTVIAAVKRNSIDTGTGLSIIYNRNFMISRFTTTSLAIKFPSDNYGYIFTNDTNYNFYVIKFDGSLADNNKVSISKNLVNDSITFNGTIPTAVSALTETINIGQFTGGYANENIDLLMIYNRILTTSETNKLYKYWGLH